MSLLDLQGVPLDSEHKRAHDSERVMGIRGMLNGFMQELRKGWKNDMASDPTGATVPNEAAVDQHYVGKWVQQCTAIMNSNDPVEVDPEAFTKWVAEQRATSLRNENMAKPLHAITDLEPMGFKLLGLHKGATIWVSSECAVMLVPGGMVAVFLRFSGITSKHFVCTACMVMVNDASPDVLLPDYTLGELTDYLMAQRRERPTHPEEEDLVIARERLSPVQP